MKKPTFINNGIFHIYNRGVEKRTIFLDDRDYLRFLYALYEFNDENPALNLYYKKPYETQRSKEFILKKRNQLVHIYAFCLMSNHFHLLLRQVEDDGIVKFMHKMGTGYTNFFNKKYERSGHLFQGGFKAVSIKEDSQLLYVPYYIHANPLDIYTPGWREAGILNWRKAMQIIENYKYTSHLIYARENYQTPLPILESEFLTSILGGPTQYRRDMEVWLRDKDKKSAEFEDVLFV